MTYAKPPLDRREETWGRPHGAGEVRASWRRASGNSSESARTVLLSGTLQAAGFEGLDVNAISTKGLGERKIGGGGGNRTRKDAMGDDAHFQCTTDADHAQTQAESAVQGDASSGSESRNDAPPVHVDSTLEQQNYVKNMQRLCEAVSQSNLSSDDHPHGIACAQAVTSVDSIAGRPRAPSGGRGNQGPYPGAGNQDWPPFCPSVRPSAGRAS